jgi:DNA polymerase-3 subunit delta
MKIPPRAIDGFVRKPGADVIVVLVYGPDGGLVRERAEALTRSVAGKTDDPFLVTELTAADLRADPARLMDEAAALAFGGGRRVVRLRGAGDDDAKGLAAVLETLGASDAPSPALVIAEAGELAPRSKLRKLVEDAKRGAALPCYLDDGRGLAEVIRETLAAHGLRPSADAMAWLVQHLGSDRRVTRSEIDKLALFCVGKTEVGLDDCTAVVGDASAMDLEQAIFAAAGGEMPVLEAALARAFREGESPITVIRAAMRHMQRLHQVTGAMAEGSPIDAAMKMLKPPPFFKVADRFRAQARAWPVGQVEAALALLSEAEVGCKTTGMPDQLLCARTLMQIAQAGRRARRA